MTGRDLIIYILENKLEDERIFENGRFLNFMTPSEAASKMGVGIATIFTWIFRGQLEYVKLGDIYLIPTDCELTYGDCNE